MIDDNGYKILDIGCNDGSFSKFLKKQNNYVVGIEINKILAMEAKKKIDRVIIQSAEQSWEIKTCDFDIVHMGAFLEHIFDYNFILEEANRVLKKGGLLIISVPCITYLLNRIKLLFGLHPFWYEEFQHIRIWSKPFLEKKLKEHGFKPLLWRGAFIRHFSKIEFFVNLLSKIFPAFFPILIVKAKKL